MHFQLQIGVGNPVVMVESNIDGWSRSEVQAGLLLSFLVVGLLLLIHLRVKRRQVPNPKISISLQFNRLKKNFSNEVWGCGIYLSTGILNKIIIAAYNCVPGTIVTKAGFQK